MVGGGGRDAEQGRGGEMKKLALPSTPSHERERGNDSNDREDGSLARRATRREWDVVVPMAVGGCG